MRLTAVRRVDRRDLRARRSAIAPARRTTAAFCAIRSPHAPASIAPMYARAAARWGCRVAQALYGRCSRAAGEWVPRGAGATRWGAVWGAAA